MIEKKSCRSIFYKICHFYKRLVFYVLEKNFHLQSLFTCLPTRAIFNVDRINLAKKGNHDSYKKCLSRITYPAITKDRTDTPPV